jgi:hypothetical protein
VRRREGRGNLPRPSRRAFSLSPAHRHAYVCVLESSWAIC